ncbi:hypothetical protein BD324DRAFT_649443 [Kockovaella imperatae]|uniref:Zn(2)-C6 fungal-type domain-containing protein n=1 Tax=Kockovaella imperatae TaxID=4999 RepID=A0A1Y1UP89_9TREE|nr:hypothetical protein BD324DRAFT_649443 [Kockovaella imperatae]ORX39367.1 hypothetical protein BD324DRAFT_649443 [Kockovaella imperatae]
MADSRKPPLPSPHSTSSVSRAGNTSADMHHGHSSYASSPSPRQNSRYTQPASPPNKRHSSGGPSEGEGSEELTTKGRKRKRLAKACSACHKNKRRCDGFAPCANCEFSSRECLYINAQGEIIPPPRTRDPSKQSSAPESSVPLPQKQPRIVTPTLAQPITPTRDDKHAQRIIDLVDSDQTLSAELVHLFFHHVHPYGAMFHSATFYHRLYLGQVSLVLIHAIYAIASHLCTNPVLLSLLPPTTPPHARGMVFAERADAIAKKILASQIEPRAGWEDTELAQGLVLLSIYYAHGDISNYYLDSAKNLLRTLETRNNTLAECRARLSWMITMHGLSVGSIKFSDAQKVNLSLPGGEALWQRYGERSDMKRDGILPGAGNRQTVAGQVGEIGYAIRILYIFNNILSVANSTSRDMRRDLLALEQELKNWAMSLPPSLRFQEYTLATASSQLASPLDFVSRCGWLFGLMHCIAESGMYRLQGALGTLGEEWTAERQGQAADNIIVIMDAMGRKGRTVPLIPLFIVNEWHARTRNVKLDHLMARWWREVKEDWDLDPAVLARRFQRRLDRSPGESTLGLYNTSPRDAAPESIMSSRSSTNLVTPGMWKHPSMVPSQSYLKSRSDNLLSYHTVRSSSEDGSGAATQTGPRLPPIQTVDLKSPTGYFDLPKSSRLSVSPMGVPKTSPRFDPYAGVRDGAASASPSLPQFQRERMDRIIPRRSPAETAEEPVTGIDALVTAAEAKSKAKELAV